MKIITLLLALLCTSPTWAAQVCDFVNASTPSDVASGNLTLNAPASPAVNDIWIAVISSHNDETHVFTDWNQIREAESSFGNVATSIWWFRYAGSTPNLIVQTTSTDVVTGAIAQLRGCDVDGSPVDTLGTTTQTANNATITMASITPATSNTLLLGIAAASNNSAVVTPPTGMTLGFDATTATGGNKGLRLYYKSHTSGATGTFTVVTGDSNQESQGVLLAIEEEPVTSRRLAAPVIF